eukprot:TRINITY_DN21617_c0_g1_i1.p1 TRINITY_DN21617_c0_g1~~TRINITY_DN21617_c0_g1_i1.p1  ORF type:complete len:350 (+),score=73.40 TRINITY_DN21617_c0_g1_i1:143-1192(+)
MQSQPAPSDPAPPKPARKKKRVCRHYLQGRCSAGDRCKFAHPPGGEAAPRTQRRVPQLWECCNAVTSQRCRFGRDGSACCFMHLDIALAATGGTLAELGAMEFPPLQGTHLQSLSALLGAAVKHLSGDALCAVDVQMRAVPGCAPIAAGTARHQLKPALRTQLTTGPFNARMRECLAADDDSALGAAERIARARVLLVLYTILCPLAPTPPPAGVPIAAPLHAAAAPLLAAGQHNLQNASYPLLPFSLPVMPLQLGVPPVLLSVACPAWPAAVPAQLASSPPPVLAARVAAQPAPAVNADSANWTAERRSAPQAGTEGGRRQQAEDDSISAADGSQCTVAERELDFLGY